MKRIIVLALSIIMLLSVGCSAAVSVVGANINEDGHLVLSMSDGSTIDAGYTKGEDGIDGKDGLDGKDGRDGIDGVDGVGIKKAAVNDSGHLMIRLTDDTLIDTGYVIGADGKDGRDGVDGRDGRDGADGKDGAAGASGKTPYIGDNGNWWIGDEDTGVKAKENEFIFDEQGKGSVLLAYVGHSQDVIIPNQAKSIDNYAFSGNKAICNVTIPDGVTSIGFGAFSNCTNLQHVDMPVNEIFIEGEAFCYTDLETIDLSKAVRIGTEAFASSSLKGHLNLGCTPNRDAFFECGIESVRINMIHGLEIGEDAFFGCFNLKSAELVLEGEYYSHSFVIPTDPPTVSLKIGSGAFTNCPLTDGIIFPDETHYPIENSSTGVVENREVVFNINSDAFCSVRTDSFTLPATLKILGSNVLSKYIKTITVEATIPPDIKADTFDSCIDLTAIYVPSASVDAYKAASGWSSYADNIQAMS